MIELLVSIVCLSEIPENFPLVTKLSSFVFLSNFLSFIAVLQSLNCRLLLASGQTEFSKVLLFASEVTEVFIEESDMSDTPEVVFLEVSEELVDES